jgi:putative chitinase
LATSRLHDFGIDVDLVANPELALRPDVAAAVMVMGMRDGWFTGRKLSDDLPLKGPAGLSQFTASRDIINGHDRQADVATYANDFQTGLQHGGYKIAA